MSKTNFNINNELLKKYLDNGYIPILCKGHTDKYNPTKDYKKSKQPIENNFTKPDFIHKSMNELINHLNANGSIGWLLPENIIALDIENVDTIEQVKQLIKDSGIEDNVGIHKTKNGYHFIFKIVNGENYSANTNALMKIGCNATYRIGKKNYLILEPWIDRMWENFVDNTELAELQDLLKPIDNNKQSDLLNALAIQVRYYYDKGILRGYDDIDTSLMGFLALDLELPYDEIESIFKTIYDIKYQDDTTRMQYEKCINHNKPKKVGSFIQKIKIEKLDSLQNIIKKLTLQSKNRIIYVNDNNVINELNKRYKIINERKDIDELNKINTRNPYNSFIVFNDEKVMIPIFKESSNSIVNPAFENIITNDFLIDFRVRDDSGDKLTQYKFKVFWNLLTSLIFHKDDRLKIDDVIISNLSVLIENTFIYLLILIME